MMFNSINSDINNYKSIPYQRQYVKQQFVKHNNSRIPSKSQYEPQRKSQYRHSPYSKLKPQSQISFQQKDLYRQNYEVRSPFQQNLRHSNVKSYTSEQYYYGSQSDSQSEKSNQWSRNTASYFPTSQMLPSQSQMYSSTNPFKKHTEKKPSYNFDTFSNKSKSRIKEMNEKIDQTTNFIIKNGLVHQRQPTNLRSSSKQRSQEKIIFESPRNLQKHPSRISSDRRNYSSIERKNKFATQNNVQPQIIKRSEDFILSKPLIFATNNYVQKARPERIIPHTASISTTINSPFQSNQRMNVEKNFNQSKETINFLNFGEVQNIKSQFRQKSYQLPSTYRKDITFNEPVFYTSQSQQTFNKSRRSNLKGQQFKISSNNLPQFELKSYSRSKNKMENISKLQSQNQFQPTDLIVLNRNYSNKKPFAKIPSRQSDNYDKNPHSSRLNYGINRQQPLKRTSSFDQNVEFFELNKNYDAKTNFKNQDPDFEFKDFEDESSGIYEKFVPSEEKNQYNFADSEKKIYNKLETHRTENIGDPQLPTEKQNPTQKSGPYKKYIQKMKDKQSQVIAAALIILAMVILFIQLAS